jgi:hypothetical protein
MALPSPLREINPDSLPLAELEPPGEMYRHWHTEPPGEDPFDDVVNYLLPMYDGRVPQAAIILECSFVLNEALVIGFGEDIAIFRFNDLIEQAPFDMDIDKVTALWHNIHAGGGVLMDDAGILRMVVGRTKDGGWAILEERPTVEEMRASLTEADHSHVMNIINAVRA